MGLLAIGQVMNNLTNIVAYIAYGAGFASGTFIGMLIEEKISIGLVTSVSSQKKTQPISCNTYGRIITVLPALMERVQPAG